MSMANDRQSISQLPNLFIGTSSPPPFIKFKHVKIKPNKMTVEQDNKVRKIH